MNGDAADVAELVNVSDTWKYRDGLISRIKHKMLSKSMSYTSALVEASADRLLQREDELGKFAVDKNNFSQLDPLVICLTSVIHICCLGVAAWLAGDWYFLISLCCVWYLSSFFSLSPCLCIQSTVVTLVW